MWNLGCEQQESAESEHDQTLENATINNLITAYNKLNHPSTSLENLFSISALHAPHSSRETEGWSSVLWLLSLQELCLSRLLSCCRPSYTDTWKLLTLASFVKASLAIGGKWQAFPAPLLPLIAYHLPLNPTTFSVEVLQGEATEGFLPGQISSSSGYGSLKGWPPGDLASSWWLPPVYH